MSGRKAIYDSKIKPRFKDIEKWIKGGATERQVAQALGIAYSTFNKYKADNKEFQQLLQEVDRTEIVLDLRSALLKKALGFTYEEKKKYSRQDEDGNKITYVEITEKTALPDVAAINLALKNYDAENWSNDPQALDLKKQELELKKLQLEKEDW